MAYTDSRGKHGKHGRGTAFDESTVFFVAFDDKLKVI
jgi:hypothetical protein